MSDQIIEENNTNPSPLIPEENIIKNQTDNEPHPDTNSEDISSITSEGNKLMKENLMKALALYSPLLFFGLSSCAADTRTTIAMTQSRNVQNVTTFLGTIKHVRFVI